MLNSPCLKDTKSGATAIADGNEFHVMIILGPVTQLVVSLTSDPGVASSAQSHTFMETDHEIISTVILLRRVVVSYKRKYVHKVLVDGLVKLAQEKSVGR